MATHILAATSKLPSSPESSIPAIADSTSHAESHGGVPAACAAQYVTDGYCIIRRCVGAAAVAALRRECAALLHGGGGGGGSGGGPVDLDETDCVVDLWAVEPVHAARARPPPPPMPPPMPPRPRGARAGRLAASGCLNRS
jgi:hypothetical protein